MGNQVFKLHCISENLSQLNEWMQVEFIKGQNGVITAIKMHWDNGIESIKGRHFHVKCA